MAIEMSDATNAWVWRVSPEDPRMVQRRSSRKGARWQDYERHADLYAARAAVARRARNQPQTESRDLSHGES